MKRSLQIENQKFLSLEAVRHLVSQLTFLGQAPKGLDTPDFMIMRRFGDCDVRRWAVASICQKWHGQLKRRWLNESLVAPLSPSGICTQGPGHAERCDHAPLSADANIRS